MENMKPITFLIPTLTPPPPPLPPRPELPREPLSQQEWDRFRNDLDQWTKDCQERNHALNRYAFEFYYALKALGKKPTPLPNWSPYLSPSLFPEMNHDQQLIEEARAQLEGPQGLAQNQQDTPPARQAKRLGGSGNRKKTPRSFLDDPNLTIRHQVTRVDEENNPLPDDAQIPDDLQQVSTQRSFTIAYQPSKVQLEVHDRVIIVSKSLGDKSRDQIVSPAVAKPFEHGIGSASLVAYTLDEKLHWYQTLYRLEQRLAGMGCPISRSTLGDWFKLGYEGLWPILQSTEDYLLHGNHLHLDGTIWRLRDLEEEKIVRFVIYGMLNDREHPMALFKVVPLETISMEEWVAKKLSGFKGEVVADCGQELGLLFKRPDVIHVGCNSHGFRKFEDAEKTDSRARDPLKIYREICRIEREFKGRPPPERLEARKKITGPLFEELKAWCIRASENAFGPLLPKSDLAAAAKYVLRHWAVLTRHLEDGKMDFDNNALEALWHLLGILRRNSLFAGSLEGAERIAGLFSLAISCKLNGIDPFDYFSDVLLRVKVHPAGRMIELAPPFWRNLPPLDLRTSFGLIRNDLIPPGSPLHEQYRREAKKAFEGRA
jgi:hypothetical protein